MSAVENPLGQLAARYYPPGSVALKPASYWTVYHRLLGHRRNAPLRLLELGVLTGASLKVWRDYLPEAVIVGLDRNPVPALIAADVHAGRLIHVQGDQTDPDALGAAAAHAGPSGFDVIIDDASHIGSLSQASFNWLFERALAPGGSYVVEDYGTAYRDDFPDGRRRQVQDAGGISGSLSRLARRLGAVQPAQGFPSHDAGMVGWLKGLIDEQNTWSTDGRGGHRYPIEAITFWQSIALITKDGRPEAVSGRSSLP